MKLIGGVVRCNSGTLDEQGNEVEDEEAFCSEFVAAALQVPICVRHDCDCVCAVPVTVRCCCL